MGPGVGDLRFSGNRVRPGFRGKTGDAGCFKDVKDSEPLKGEEIVDAEVFFCEGG